MLKSNAGHQKTAHENFAKPIILCKIFWENLKNQEMSDKTEKKL